MEKNIIWEIRYHSFPPALKYCKKCGRKTTFICSEQFRVNAQKNCLDIWLIYNCANCRTTWNASVYSRISPHSLDPRLLDGFHRNDKVLVGQYAMDFSFLHRNGAEAGLPDYVITGDSFSPCEAVRLTIRCGCPFPIKIASIVRDKLHLSGRDYAQLVAKKELTSIPDLNLLKCKWREGIILLFHKDASVKVP